MDLFILKMQNIPQMRKSTTPYFDHYLRSVFNEPPQNQAFRDLLYSSKTKKKTDVCSNVRLLHVAMTQLTW